MKKTAFLAIVVAFVIFSDKAAVAGVFGNDLLELTPDQELVVRAALGEQVAVRVKVAEGIPLPQAQIPAAPTPVTAPVAQAPANFQPPLAAPVAPLATPPVQVAKPERPPAVHSKQPEAKVASAPLTKPAAPAMANPAPAKPATPVAVAPAKPAVPVNQEQLAKASTAPNPGKEARKLYAMRVPVENIPAEKRIINGKMYKDGEQVWAVVEEVNGVADQKNIRIMNAPPEGAEIVPFRG